MSEHGSEHPEDRSDEDGPLSVPDEDLPEDLRPSEDNPLAQPAGEDTPDDLLKDTAGGGGSSEPAGDQDQSDEGPDGSDDGSDEGPEDGS